MGKGENGVSLMRGEVSSDGDLDVLPSDEKELTFWTASAQAPSPRVSGVGPTNGEVGRSPSGAA